MDQSHPAPTRPTPMRPPVRWFGSKTRLAPLLAARLPDHDHYVEVFAGSAAVLFAKAPSRLESVNDLDGRIVNLFRVLRDPDLAERLAQAVFLTPYAREEFYAAKETDTDDPVEMARRFLVTAHQAVGNAGEGWSTTVTRSAVSAARVNRWAGIPERLVACAARLRLVQVDSVDWRVAVDRYDAPGVCMFIDPPYHHDLRPNTVGGYAHEMSGVDHDELVERLIGLEHATAIVTHYPHPVYERLTGAGWHAENLASHADNPTGRRQEARVERIWTSPGAARQMQLTGLTA